MMTVVKSRRIARELVLQGLYAEEMTRDSPCKIVEDLKRKSTFCEESSTYFERLLTTTIKQRDWTSSLIKERLENWDLSRVALIDRLVLQMMITEMVFFDDVPSKVSIAEGVEIVRKFSTDESSRFVNGILDAVFHSLEELSVPAN
ncbi:MAG: transcription antitermination factor NusB [Candidatus Marinimicrobia bacterium]|nr:transcription antitermination factor NusB [Candidatus Neomarinimicrobiota bacterium]|tara:strand:- start:3123 stop:3560 length:438 start_codon:yes stop_codon:yes gene_type:complete